MPRRQANPLLGMFLFLLPFIIAFIVKGRNTHKSRYQFNNQERNKKQNNTKTKPRVNPDFMKMTEWNTIVPERPSTHDYLLTPEPNKAHWYAFLFQ
jgi:hypothetical protein